MQGMAVASPNKLCTLFRLINGAEKPSAGEISFAYSSELIGALDFIERSSNGMTHLPPRKLLYIKALLPSRVFTNSWQ
jgi:hypothetical protein